ncbi:MAG: putative DNA binding domain-containing protein [Rhodoferax sp.]|nr:putative DNA binding domain-containing protein [Rhodoferax sp.]
MSLLEQIQRGEGKTLELKLQLPRHAQIAQTAIAFANTSGGKLVIGVDDARQIVGIAEDQIFSLQDQIIALITDRCYPPILPEIYTANVDGKLLLVVEIFRGNLLPYYLKSESKENGTYLRIGASNRKAALLHVIELERQRASQSFDEEIYPEDCLQHLDLAPLRTRFAAQGKPLDDEKLKNLKLIRQEQGQLLPTHGLMILLGQVPHAVTKCARFKGTDMHLFLDRKEYSGDLFSQLEQAEAFIKNHINLRGEIKGLQRTDTYELPQTALREALTNAIIHRDYTNQGRDIKVGVYDDIVNIVSPGGFPNTLTAEGLTEGRSEIRNRAIARVFKELGYIEQWGSGLQRIKNTCLAQGLKAPRIREQGDFVDVEFYRPEPGSTGYAAGGDENRPDADDYGRLRTITDDWQKIDPMAAHLLTYLLAHGQISRKQTTELLGLGKTKAHALLSSLLDKGLLERKGQGRSTCYVLPPAVLEKR